MRDDGAASLVMDLPGVARARRRVRWTPMPIAGALVLAAVVAGAALAPVVAPADPARQSLRDRLTPPAWVVGGSPAHVAGTDYLGRDILSRVLYGGRVSLLVGVLGLLVATTLGTAWGIAAGYYGGRVDTVLMRGDEIVLAVPRILLAILMVVLFGGGLVNMVVFMGLSSWTWLARVMRSRVRSLRTEPFVLAAQALGVRPTTIMWRHVLPNVTNIIVVIGVMQFGYIVILESTLSFLGLSGFTLSWGLDVAMGRNYLTLAWWPATIPGAAIFATVAGAMMLGYWVRDRFDPHCRLVG